MQTEDHEQKVKMIISAILFSLPTTSLIVDDNPIVRAALNHLPDQVNDLDIICEYCTAKLNLFATPGHFLLVPEVKSPEGGGNTVR